ncbi:MAG: WG repeat-containing protein [Candidatus Sericytochromatia bacterium]
MKKTLILFSTLSILFFNNYAFAENKTEEMKDNTKIENKLEAEKVIELENIWKIFSKNRFLENRFLIKQDGKFALIDDNFEYILEPKYDMITNFYGDENFIVENNKNLNLINQKGELILKDTFKRLINVDKNLYYFSKDNKNFGVIDYKDNIIIKPKYQDIKPLIDNKDLYIVKYNNKYSIIDKKENFLVKDFKYKISNFYENRIIFSTEKGYGLADKNGNILVKPEYFLFLSSKNKMFYAKKTNNQSAFFDLNGKKLFSNKYNYPYNPNYDLIIIEKDKKSGLMDLNGKVVVPPKYDFIFTSLNNTYSIINNRKYGLIDEKGKVVVEPKYEYIDIFGKENKTIFRENKKFGIIDSKGNIVLKPKFDEINFIYGNYASVKLGNKFGAIDKNGKIVIEPKYEYFDMFNNFGISNYDYSIVRLNGKTGVVDTNDKIILDIKYDDVKAFSNKVFIVRENNDYLFLNVKNNLTKKVSFSSNNLDFPIKGTVRENMHIFQTMLETFSVDNRGIYPKDVAELLKEAENKKYKKNLVNFEDSKLPALVDGNCDIKGVVIYQPIKDKNGKINSYKIFANDKDGKLLKDKNGKDIYLSND